MLNYKDSILLINKPIDKADSILTLYTDIKASFVGVINFNNAYTKSLSFIQDNNLYKTRLVLTEEDIPYLSNCTLSLIVIDNNTEKTSNTETISFDIDKIKRTIKKSTSNDIKDIKIDIAKLSKRLDSLTNNVPSFIVNHLSTINSSYIKPGMIPVAIDETGRCIFQYPFIDHVTEINGQKTVNNAILITAKDIPIEQTDVATAIKAHTDAIKELNNLMKTVSSELKSTKNKVADIEKALLQHTDSSII